MRRKELFFLLSAWLFIMLLHSYYLKERYYVNDVAGYAYNTLEVMNGRGWYASTWHNKPPGINFIYLIAFSIFGKSFITTQIIALLADILSAFLLYLLGRYILYKEIRLFFLLPISFALFCVSVGLEGHCANTETFLAVFEIAGMLFLGLAYKKKKNTFYFMSGLMLGIAFMIKQAGLMTFIAGLIFIFVVKIIDKKDVKFLIGKLFIFIISFFIPLALLSIFFLSQGVFDKFIKYTFIIPYQYGKEMSAVARMRIIQSREGIWDMLGIELIVFGISALFGTLYILLKRSRVMILILIWFIICCFEFSLFGIFPHYYIQLIAPFVCLSVIGLSYIYQNILRERILKVSFSVLLVIPYLHTISSTINSGTLIIPETGQYRFLASQQDRFLASQYIKKRTNPQDKIFVWDDIEGCSIYFWTGLTNITHFRVKYCFLPKELMRPQQRAFAGDYKLNQKSFLSDLNKELPIYIIIVDDDRYGPDSEKKAFLEFFDILEKRYVAEAKIGICTIYRLIS